MNSHRHDLETNELEKLASRATPFLEKNGMTILFVVGAVLIVALLATFFAGRGDDGDGAGWAKILDGSNAEDFENVAEDFEGQVVPWAQLSAAEANLDQGIRLLFEDRKGSASDLEKAREAFQELLDQSQLDPTIRERATIGMARCLEATPADAGGDREEARKLFESLVEKSPDSIYVDYAKSRAAALAREDAKEFYAFFDAAKPIPRDQRNPAGPSFGSDFEAPLILPELPEELQLPEEDLLGPTLEIPETDTPPVSNPIPDDAPAAKSSVPGSIPPPPPAPSESKSNP